MENILFSVIIPCYNSEPYIHRCLTSLMNQTYKNWEAIIVDNHSEDRTIERIKEFDDDRIQHHFIHNEGIIAKSRNYGIQFAKGQFICFLDSDDWWKANKLEVCKEYCVSDNIFIYHDFKFFREKKNALRARYAFCRELPAKDRVKDLLCGGNTIGASTVCLSRELLNRHLSCEEKRAAGVEDFDLWLRILKDDTVKAIHLNQVLGYYYVGNTFSASREHLYAERYLLNKYLDQFDKAIKREIILTWMFHKANYFYSNKLYKEAGHYYKKTVASRNAFIRKISKKTILKCLILQLTNHLFNRK